MTPACARPTPPRIADGDGDGDGDCGEAAAPPPPGEPRDSPTPTPAPPTPPHVRAGWGHDGLALLVHCAQVGVAGHVLQERVEHLEGGQSAEGRGEGRREGGREGGREEGREGGELTCSGGCHARRRKRWTWRDPSRRSPKCRQDRGLSTSLRSPSLGPHLEGCVRVCVWVCVCLWSGSPTV